MNNQKKSDTKNKKSARKFFTQPKDFGMLFVGIISVLYVLNITFGIVEILPDNLPFIGNIDEALVTGLLISVLQYFDINVTQWFNRK